MVQFYLLPSPPTGHTPILFSLGGLFPTPGHAERDNSPTPGTEGLDLSPGLPGGVGRGVGGMVTGKIEQCINLDYFYIAFNRPYTA